MTTTKDAMLEGKVAAVNSHGVRLEGRHDWVNWSKFGVKAEEPAPGNIVRLRIDSAGFMRECIIVDDHKAYNEVSHNGNGHGEQPASSPKAPDKDRMIARMNVLGHAVAICTSGGRQAKVLDVLECARQLEHWVVRWE